MIIEAEGIRSGYGRLTVLYDVTLSCDVGEMVMLRGPNGAGKTTFMKTLLGVLPVQGGDIHYRGTRITAQPAAKRFASGIAMSPEGRRIFSRLSVYENLVSGAFGVGKAEAAEQIERVYELFPKLQERNQQRAGSLSGGEQQMLAIGRSLMSRPRFLMVDELSLGLAPLIVEKIVDALKALCEQGLSVLVVDEFQSHVSEAADRIYELKKGRIVNEVVRAA